LNDSSHYLLDVRSETEFSAKHIPGASNIPLEQLRERFQELPRNQEIWLVCGVGQRAYYAARMLLQYDFQARILSGGMQTYLAILELPEDRYPSN
jgi:rhodanese-related sulfurtransferase